MWDLATIGLASLEDEENLFQQDESAIVERLRQTSMREFVLKCGGDGVRAFSAEQEHAIPTLPKVASVVDATGAGDSFNAAYLHARLHSQPIEQAVLAGHELAMKVISNPGAIIKLEQ